jgi:lysine 2,3-aminomutase
MTLVKDILSNNTDQNHTWITELQKSYRSYDDLLSAGILTPGRLSKSTFDSLAQKYQFRLPRYYAALIDPTDPRCPIAAQALPHGHEQDPELGPKHQGASQRIYGRATPWSTDPIGDLSRLAAPRLTHRYGNRALLHVSSSCSMYCRFCFRKNHLGEREDKLYGGDYGTAFTYLRQHPEITEVILTGGDPLSLIDGALLKLMNDLANATPSLRVLRIHSRMPVTLPHRLTKELGAMLGEFSKNTNVKVVLVTHFNHPKELTDFAKNKLEEFIRLSRALVLNQSVLLVGVNNNTSTLSCLLQELYNLGIAPYYLHHPDWTAGTFYCRISIEEGRRLYGALRGVVSGPALPRYVLDVPGGLGKIDLIDSEVIKIEDLPQENGLCGAIYQVPLAHTNTTTNIGGGFDRFSTPGKTLGPSSNRALYLDLFPGPAAP